MGRRPGVWEERALGVPDVWSLSAPRCSSPEGSRLRKAQQRQPRPGARLAATGWDGRTQTPSRAMNVFTSGQQTPRTRASRALGEARGTQKGRTRDLPLWRGSEEGARATQTAPESPQGERAPVAGGRAREGGTDGHGRSGGLLSGSDAGAQLCSVGANGDRAAGSGGMTPLCSGRRVTFEEKKPNPERDRGWGRAGRGGEGRSPRKRLRGDPATELGSWS